VPTRFQGGEHVPRATIGRHGRIRRVPKELAAWCWAVGTYRADDPGQLLAGWLAETRRLPEVSWLELPRFTRAELAAQLAGLRGGPVDGRVVAAVGGRSVCHDWLAAVAGGPDDELDDGALREAVDCGLLQITEMEQAGQEVYEFRHALLQEAVYGELLPGQRARLHGAYANALAGMPAGRLPAAPQFAAELAEHWYRAGQPAEALAWSVRAAGRAERVYAHGEAARHCERVLELWDQVPDAAGRAGTDRAALHTRAAQAWEYAGDETRAPSHVATWTRRSGRRPRGGCCTRPPPAPPRSSPSTSNTSTGANQRW
jgi:hypothetical protein